MIVMLVEQVLALNGRLVKAAEESGKAALQQQIEERDHQIDMLVYELYDLTPNEIAIAERVV